MRLPLVNWKPFASLLVSSQMATTCVLHDMEHGNEPKTYISPLHKLNV